MLEEKVEDHLRNRVKEGDGLCVKLNPQNYVGIPDRLVLMPGGQMAFVELKKPKRARVAAMQSVWHELLQRLGFRVEVAYTIEQVDKLVLDLVSRRY